MTDHDREAFARGIFALGETFSEAVSDLRVEAYFGALKDLPLPSVLEAMREAVRDRRFFPRPVELRELVEGSAEDRGEIAWMAVMNLVRRVGYYGTPTWPDEATRRAALELFGGWQRLCEMLPADGPALLGWAKQFKAAYRSYDNRVRRELPELTAKDLLVLEDMAGGDD